MTFSLSREASVSKDVRTVLVVDDEGGVIEAIRQSLEQKGLEENSCNGQSLEEFNFRVFTTTNPRHALQILKSLGRVDVLIVDLFMPVMDGATLLRKSRQIQPDLRAVLTTGAAS